MKALGYFAAGTLAVGAVVGAGSDHRNQRQNNGSCPRPHWWVHRLSVRLLRSRPLPPRVVCRGIADVIRSQGDYNLSSSAAAVNLTMAQQQAIENQKKWVQTYFQIRDINRQTFDAEQNAAAAVRRIGSATRRPASRNASVPANWTRPPAKSTGRYS